VRAGEIPFWPTCGVTSEQRRRPLYAIASGPWRSRTSSVRPRSLSRQVRDSRGLLIQESSRIPSSLNSRRRGTSRRRFGDGRSK
jgi:hypothetical protein